MAGKTLLLFSMFLYILIIAPTTTLSIRMFPGSPLSSPSPLSIGMFPLSSPSNSPSFSPSPSPLSAPSPLFSSPTPSPSHTSVSGSDVDPYFPYYKPEPEFFSFKYQYGKNYRTKEEHDYRFSVFKDNLLRAIRHQEIDTTADHGITQYSDLTQEEFMNTFLGGEAKYMHGHRPISDHQKASLLPTDDFPELFNWRHEHDSDDDHTPININQLIVAVSSDEDQIKANLLKYGPLAVAFDATFMQTYKGGISCPSTCTNQPKHGALLVGYRTFKSYIEGSEPDVPYWIITNLPEYGKDYSLCRAQNVCGVESWVSTLPEALST